MKDAGYLFIMQLLMKGNSTVKKLNVKTGLFNFSAAVFLVFLITAGATTAHSEKFVTVSGIVKNSMGQPVQNALVNIEPDDMNQLLSSSTEPVNIAGSRGKTDENGVFSIYVEPVNLYYLFISSTGMSDPTALGGYFQDADGTGGLNLGADGKWSGSVTRKFTDRAVFQVGIDGISDMAITLEKGSRIYGKALDSNGSPARDIVIKAGPGRSSPSAETDDQGFFSIAVHPRDGYMISTDPRTGGFAGGRWKAGEDSTLTSSGQDGGITRRWDDVTLLDASANVEINIIFKAANTISGRITDKSGNPVSRVWARATPHILSSFGEDSFYPTGWGSETDENGYYEIAVYPASDYTISISGRCVYQTPYYKDAADIEDATPVDASNGPVTGIDFVLDMSKSISGTLSGLQAGYTAIIEVWSDSPGIWTAAKAEGTGSDVNFRIQGLSDGPDYRINVLTAGGRIRGYVQSDGTLGLREKAATFSPGADDVKIYLNNGRKISGRISGLTSGDSVRIEAVSELEYCGKDEYGIMSYCEETDIEIITIRSQVEIIAQGPTADFTITGLVSAPNFRVSVWAEGCIGGYYGGEPGAVPVSWDKASLISTSDSDVSGVNILMSTGNTVSGVVTGLNPGDYALISAWSQSTSSPSKPNIIYTSHQSGVTSTDNTIDIAWERSTDPDEDLNGYASAWNQSKDTANLWIKNLGPNATSVTSNELPDAPDWYFHIRAVDDTGKYSDIAHMGPFSINTQPNILSVDPGNGKNDSLTIVSIIGNYFMRYPTIPTVSIGETAINDVNVVFKSETELTVTVPAELAPGTYDIRVVNSNGKIGSKENGFTVLPADNNPWVNAGDDQHILFGNMVKLEGQAFSNPDENWKYNWTMIARPADSTAVIAGNNTLALSFTPDKTGTYRINFTATDGEGRISTPDTVNIVVYKTELIDVNKDSAVDLTDIILVLQMLAGLNPDGIQTGADVDSDGRIGMPEAVCILRIVSSAGFIQISR